MNENEKATIAALRAENEQLKRDNEMLQKIVVQMQMTLERLINRYVSGKKGTI